jgi:hypothetical protein
MLAKKDLTEQRLLDASSIIEEAPYMLQVGISNGEGSYGLKCASSQSKNCTGNGVRSSEIYGLKCASSQSKNCTGNGVRPNETLEEMTISNE